MKAGDIWVGIDGTQYLVVLPGDVNDEPRWWIDRGLLDEFDRATIHGFKTAGGTRWQVGPDDARDLHVLPYCATATDDHQVMFALVLP